MQRLERLLSTNLAILAVIGSIMLGLGQLDIKLPVLVFIGALTSVVYTDRRKVFSLNHHVANLAALGAVGLALFDFSASDRNQQLLAIANLLVYLQVVVFFQEKNARIFGQLAMLSLLQVVVAAALNYSIFFSVLILGYMGIGLPTLSLFFFYRELSKFVVVNDKKETGVAATESVLAAAAIEQQMPVKRGRKRRRWPLAGQKAIFNGADFQQDEEAFGKGGLLAFTARMSVFTLILTLFIFIFAPRFGRTPWQATSLQPTRIVGYSEEVNLNKTGNTTENPEIVMRVGLVNEETGRRIRLVGSPLFRGSVLTGYDLERKRWSQHSRGYGPHVENLPPVERGMRNLVRQEITLEPLVETTAFALFPVYVRKPNSSVIKYDVNRRQLFRSSLINDQQSKFNLWTTGIKDNRQKDVLPVVHRIRSKEISVLRTVPRGREGSDPFSGLKRITDEAVTNAGVDPEDPYQVAIALERFMLSQGGFKYSLEGRDLPDGIMDPIENFVTRTRIGHCEYFASALTLMLRHRGIPARIVVGFKGGDWNSIGEFYQVRQLHAHAWVEAYIQREDLEENGIQLDNGSAAWVTLDSTADTLAEQQLQGESLWSQARSIADYVEMQWITYIIGFSKEQQQEHIYNPLTEAYNETVRATESGEKQQANIPWYKKMYYFLKGLAGGEWFSWRGFLVTLILLAALAALSYPVRAVGRLLFKKVREWWRSSKSVALNADRADVAFYRNLETVLKKHGYQRQVGQTQLEFATKTGQQLAHSEQALAVSPLPREVTNAYYAVRFGRKTLDDSQTEEVEQALETLQTALSQKPNKNGNNGNHASAPK